jgi:hypothetical protein
VLAVVSCQPARVWEVLTPASCFAVARSCQHMLIKTA